MIEQNSDVWELDFLGWDRIGYVPPVPLDDIKLWTRNALVTFENTGYFFRDGHWNDCGPWPGGSVPTSKNTWGSVKGKYEGKE